MELKNKKFYLYGAGIFGKALCRYLLSIGIEPRAFIDISPSAEKYLAIPILKFHDNEFEFGYPVLLCILGYGDVGSSVKQRGFFNVVDTYDVFDMYPEALSELTTCGFVWMQEPRAEQFDDEKISELLTLLGDTASKSTLSQIINFRKMPCRNFYPEPEKYEMYFPLSIDGLYAGDNLKILDIGAFDGDTLNEYAKRWPEKIAKYLAIEVSPRHIDLIFKRGITLPNSEVEIVQGAVGLPTDAKLAIKENSSATQVRVVYDKNIESNETIVPSIQLKPLLADHDFNLIKMDIEGADYSALLQMSDFINARTPTLTLSVYHTPDDIWRIPLFINRIAPDKYHLYLRQEGHWGLETILYAIPRDVTI